MDHAEARERLADALLAPRDGGLDAALADPSATGVELRAHLGACAPCSAELDALRAIGALLAAAAPDSLVAPPSLRERVMAAVGETGAPATAPIPLRPRRRLLPLVAAMAAMVVLVAGLAGGLALVGQRQDADRQVAELGALMAATQAILADPASVRVDLAGPGGSGSVLIGSSSGRLVAFSSTLPALSAGGRYECYVERGGVRTWIGWMHWSAGLAYWSGPVSGIALPWRPGDRFLVTEGRDGVPVLVGGS
jgi:hypothetical protein